MLPRSGFLWRQAEGCLRLARDCSDPHQAEQLRRQAHELFRRVIEKEDGHRRQVAAAGDRSGRSSLGENPAG